MLLRRLTVISSKSKYSRAVSISASLRRMQDGYVEINSVPTHIYTWGQWIEDKFDEKTKDLVLIVSGNPGLPGYYTTFARSLYEEFDKKVPVWVIGHAGHDEPKKELKMKTPALKGNETLFDLKGQADHKSDFINRFLPKHVNVYLIGHSVGAKICLDLIKNHPQFSEQVKHTYLMFPTIEFIGESKKGKEVPSFNRYFFLLRMFYYALHCVPTSWKRAVVNWHCRRDEMPEEFFETSLEYTNPPVIDKIWFMALDEMEKIRELDEENIKSNMHRLKLYYGSKDDWVPTEFYHELIKRFPGIDAELCKKEYEHAFVLKTGPEVAKMVSEWINQKRMMTS